MKKQYLLILALTFSFLAFGIINPLQINYIDISKVGPSEKINEEDVVPFSVLDIGNDECADAVVLEVNTDGTCDIITSGTFEDATLSEGMPGACDTFNVVNQDVWFEFEATEASHHISISNTLDSYYLFIQVFPEDICDDSSVQPLVCTGSPATVTGLTPGEIYKIRVLSTWNISSTFDICVRTLNSPENDECEDSAEVEVNTDGTCELLASGNFQDTTLSEDMPGGCDNFSSVYQDVWFHFEATEVTHLISILNTTSTYSMYIQVFPDSICNDGDTEPLVCSASPALVSGLTPGETYKIRVFSTSNLDAAFDLCVRTLSPPENDDCDDAINVPVNTDGTCTLTEGGTFEDATLTEDMPGSCDIYSSVYQDVWFEFEATEEAHYISLESPDSYSMYIQVFSDDICEDGDTEPIVCSASPALVSSLTPGETYKIRVFTTWDINADFDICIRTLNSPENDDCDEALDVPVNEDGTCTLTASGTLEDATLSSVGSDISCYDFDNAKKDVWFEFEATQTIHKVSLLNLASSYDVFIEVFEEADCETPGAEPLVCGQDVLTLVGLTIGDTYKIRVSTTNVTNNSTFDVCVRTVLAPENDDCDGAIEVPVNSTTECEESASGTFADATLSEGASEGCGDWSTPVVDVWFEFEATTTTHGVNFETDTYAYGIWLEVYEEDICTGFVEPIACGQTVNGSLVVSQLTPGSIYKVRVYTTSAADQFDFEICVVSLTPPIRVADDEHTIPELVQDVLIGDAGDCTGISNINSITGTDFNDVNGIAYFEKNGSDFPFENGIVLSTGRAIDSEGPSEQPIESGAADYPDLGIAGWPGDEQLTDYMHDVLGNNDDYHNATVLEFDFTPATDSLKFNFIFAANEYGSFQCDYSDAFAFFLTDLETGNVENLAIVPGTTDPISVVTIRKGIHSPEDYLTGEPVCEDANPEYFYEMYAPNGQFNGQDPLGNPINYKGWTVPMTAESAVTPGKTYRIKMVIQDRQDASFDSAVFLEGGSFDIGSVDLGEDMLVENLNAVCEDEEVLLDTQLDPEQYEFEWFKDGELLEGETGSTLEVTESGTYRVEAYFDGNTTCGISDEVVIEIYPLIELEEDLSNIPICVIPGNMPEVDITIHESVFEAFETAETTLELSYHLSEEDAKENLNPIENAQAFVPEGTPVTIYIRVNNTTTGCVQVFDFDIIVQSVIEFTPPEDIPICVYPDYYTPVDLTQVEELYVSQTSLPITFTGYYLSQEESYLFENPIAESELTAFVVDELPTTIYMSILNEETGCYSFTNFDIVATETMYPEMPEDIVICDGYLVPELPAGQYYSTEEFGGGEIIESGRILGEGNHTLYINVENEIGCVFSYKYEIYVTECTPQRGISPNGDGLNDSLDLTDYHLLEIKIFNRDGMEVYSHGLGYTDQWEGQTSNGNLLPDGTYYYHFITPTGIKTGYVQLVREVE